MNGRNAVWVLTPEDVIASAKDGERYDKIYLTVDEARDITSEVQSLATNMIWDLMDKVIKKRHGGI